MIADLLIVGGGPAGMAAAIRARALGLSVTLVDEQPEVGGQIWRAVETVATSEDGARLGKDYLAGAGIAAAFRRSGATHEAATQVWQIEPGFRLFMTHAGQARMVEARAVLLAAGAQERPAPFPGWTLPGVLTVGAAQILLKASNEVPRDPVWIAGCGPLPLLYASQLLAAGGTIAGVLDTTPRRNRGPAIGRFAGMLAHPGDLKKGLDWRLALRRAGVRVVPHVQDIEAIGNGKVEAIRWRTEDGAEGTAPASVLLIHEGVVPNVHPTMAMGCAHAWNEDQRCWTPTTDAWGETSVASLFVAGDAQGIGGARAALIRGEIAAIGIARKLTMLTDSAAEGAVRPLRRQLKRALAGRPFLDAMFRPRPAVFAPRDDTIVCRCEALTAADVRAAAQVGTAGPNQVKAFTRAGMGPCQGRQCGYTVAHLLAAAQERPVADVGFYRIRPPLRPVTLGELASLEDVPS